MAKKRKSTSAASVKRKTAAAEEDRRIKKRISPKSEPGEEIVAEENVGEGMETGDFECGSGSAVPAEGEEKIEETKSLVRGDNVKEEEEADVEARFLGEPVSKEEAKKRWPDRYQAKTKVHRCNRGGELKDIVQAKFHFLQAEVDGQIYSLEDDAFVQAEKGKDSYICKIIELFEAIDGSQNFSAQWYNRANDTVIQGCSELIDKKRIFFSEITDDNPLECLVKKLRIVPLPPKAEVDVEKLKPTCDFYFDKKYLLPYSSFESLPSDTVTNSSESGSTISSDVDALTMDPCEVDHAGEKALLDLYSGCGAMSTGLCLGANSRGVKLVTKWAVDINESACQSLQLNHPETQVRNESADDFLLLLKEWEKLCSEFVLSDINSTSNENGKLNDEGTDDGEDDDDVEDGEVFEVDEILGICFGDLKKNENPELHFKIRWKGYGSEYDTWEPLECLSSCKEKLKDFVSNGYKTNLLPLPGSVDVICGGPPCQGISGFNRFRNKEAPLEDPKNKQLLVFMDIVAYLRPKFVLMENVVDILKFCEGYLGRYALGSLVGMGYQARIGMMAAGAYGLPQFRMRMFMWGALPTEKLPQYPLPTHDVINRGVTPTEFEANTVAYEAGHTAKLKDALFLGDAISDLPHVENNESRDEMPYSSEPRTEFQRFISLRRDEMPGSSAINTMALEHILYDHRPLCLNQDDYERVCQIPKRKGANFRNLPGVRVRPDNKVEWDPDVPRKYVTSGKPLVPDYAMSFVKGSSTKPFGRLWYDETVPTVVTRAEPHNQAILHPHQDRVLTIRENARLQGFPDYYKLLGGTKEKYIQVGNAVAVPVARALGYSLALALKGLSGGDGPLLTLPEEYPMMQDVPEQVVDTI